MNTYAYSSRTVIITRNFVTYTKTLAVSKSEIRLGSVYSKLNGAIHLNTCAYTIAEL